jgi:hypothetical protein
VNGRREIAEVPQSRAQSQSEQSYFGAANTVATVDHQAKVKVQRRACGESDELENLKRREFLRFRDVRNKQEQNCLKKERHRQEKLGVGSGEWGEENYFPIPIPHSPLPTPSSPDQRISDIAAM